MDKLKTNQKEFLKYIILVLTPQQRFEIEAHIVFTKDVNENVLSANDNKRIQSINCEEIYTFEISEDIIHKSEEIKYRNIIKQ